MRDAVQSPSWFRPTLVTVAAFVATRAYWFCGRPEKARTQARREEPVRAEGSQCEPCCLSAISTLPFNEAPQSFRLGFGIWSLEFET